MLIYKIEDNKCTFVIANKFGRNFYKIFTKNFFGFNNEINIGGKDDFNLLYIDFNTNVNVEELVKKISLFLSEKNILDFTLHELAFYVFVNFKNINKIESFRFNKKFENESIPVTQLVCFKEKEKVITNFCNKYLENPLTITRGRGQDYIDKYVKNIDGDEDFTDINSSKVLTLYLNTKVTSEKLKLNSKIGNESNMQTPKPQPIVFLYFNPKLNHYEISSTYTHDSVELELPNMFRILTFNVINNTICFKTHFGMHEVSEVLSYIEKEIVHNQEMFGNSFINTRGFQYLIKNNAEIPTQYNSFNPLKMDHSIPNFAKQNSVNVKYNLFFSEANEIIISLLDKVLDRKGNILTKPSFFYMVDEQNSSKIENITISLTSNYVICISKLSDVLYQFSSEMKEKGIPASLNINNSDILIEIKTIKNGSIIDFIKYA